MANAKEAVAVSPVPFADAGDADAVQDHRVKEYAGAISALPSNPKLRLRCYQGTWVRERWVPGIMAIQRSFTPRRSGDVVLASPPKCGTTWLKALAFATMARDAYPPAHPDHPLLRLNPHDCVPFMEDLFAAGWGSKLEALPSPRLMNTHIQYSALPACISTNPGLKIVYICRDPKDMLVSMWHFIRKTSQPDLSFSDFFEGACDGVCVSGPIWDHVLGYWNASKASPETVLFLRYEEMLRDPVANARKLARFLGHPFSAAEEDSGAVTNVVKLCSFEKLKNLDVNRAALSSFPFRSDVFFRRGEAGDWANHMTPEMARRLDAIVQEKLRGSGLSFA
ncbi:hypothetical protein PR202_ga31636 [Eleusine coracana subsp. coracana]|uniref:Sulfotransferase n=1 Tax=Eleusine coracana subsp. coracana TaxID=191504 RepID=A0AAV5DSE1_ELECO|nr:hypothetical protein QOZ80_7AG0575540 [Eleusine coracana subsp. coracana]GJN13282.1 hypothetical protein PR202_ga31636 [Eleusine coracana subsp. coracana]